MTTSTDFSVAGVAPMPALYLPHGAGPCFFMDWNPPHTWDRMATFLRGIAASLPAPPQAIVLVSAHWLAPQFTVNRAVQPGMMFDYYGFPPHTYELSYPAPGAPALAVEAAALLRAAGVAVASAERDYDHGVFIPLLLMFPQAQIPVLQVSLRADLDPQAHFAAGRALASLRARGALVVGSGMSFHNMRGYGDPAFGPVSDEFDHWLEETLALPADQRAQRLAQWENAPSARASHPPRAEEHLLPLHVVAGAAGEAAGRKVFSDRVLETTISAFRFD